MTVRSHIITGEPILFAPQRAVRPGAFSGDRAPERCPFCAGHEEDTPAPLEVLGSPWRVRVVPNKYPPVPGAEVIIESPDHGAAFEDLAHGADVLAVTLARYRAHRHVPYVSIFKNEGPEGGASIPHVHSQLMPVPFVPPRIAREAEAFSQARACPLCESLEVHRAEGLVIGETEGFVWLAPSGSWMAWQQWIVPKEHAPAIDGLGPDRIAELATLLRQAARAMRSVSLSFNWGFLNFPRSDAAHWYVDLFPRRTTIAGFELATGSFVEIMDPFATARQFRETS